MELENEQKIKYKITKLGNIINLKRGYDLPKQKRVEGSIPVISSSGINGFHNSYKVQGPGVTIGRSGKIGGSFYIKNNFWPLNTTLYVQDFKDNDVLFIYYLLKTINFKFLNAGSSVPTLNRNHAHEINIKTFEINIQKRISSILFTIDKKIEVNNKIIANLEEQAQAIFKSWFVDFEPFQDGNFVESELGMIPEGWEVKTIGEISKIRSGKRPENKLEKGDIPIYGANGITGWTDKVLINEPSILIGRVGTLGKVQRLNKKIWASDNTLIFTSQYLDFLYFNLLRIDYSSLNRGSTQPLIAQKDISNINIVYPDINIMDGFLKNIGNYFTYIFKLEIQNKKLAEIRDALLPKLMSGEIDVSNIKIKGEEVKNE